MGKGQEAGLSSGRRWAEIQPQWSPQPPPGELRGWGDPSGLCWPSYNSSLLYSMVRSYYRILIFFYIEHLFDALFLLIYFLYAKCSIQCLTHSRYTVNAY